MANLTYSIDELLATRFSNKYIVDFDFSGLVDVMNADLTNWNSQMEEMLSSFCEMTNKQMINTGSSETSGDFVPLDETGKAGTGIVTPGNTLGWPLRRFGKGIGVTRFWAAMATPYDLMMKQKDVEIAHRKRVMLEIQKGIYTKANSTFNDAFYDRIDIPVKGWFNADGWKIADGVTGEQFVGATHTHYKAAAALSNAAIDALVTTVAEHGSTGLQIHIPLSSKAAFVALTGFKALDLPLMNLAVTANTTIEKLDVSANPNDQFIGYWLNGMIPVFVKPFALTNYICCWAIDGDRKPLMYRVHPMAEMSGLRLWSKTDDGSIFNDQYEWLGGFAPYARENCAILYTGGAAWVDPTFSV